MVLSSDGILMLSRASKFSGSEKRLTLNLLIHIFFFLFVQQTIQKEIRPLWVRSTYAQDITCINLIGSESICHTFQFILRLIDVKKLGNTRLEKSAQTHGEEDYFFHEVPWGSFTNYIYRFLDLFLWFWFLTEETLQGRRTM